MIQISTADQVILDGVSTPLGVRQTREGTAVYTRECTLKGLHYAEHKMPHQRYSLAHAAPASGVAGIGQFEADVKALLATLNFPN